MKILLVSPKGSFTEQLKKAFIKNNTEIFYINDGEIHILPFLKNNIFLWRLLRRIRYLKRLNNFIFGKKLVNLCKTVSPDFLFVNKGMIIRPDTLLKIKSQGIKTVNWFLDNINLSPYSKWFLDTAKFYDYFLSFDSLVESYRNEIHSQIYYVPVGIDPDFFKAEPISEDDVKKYSCNLCFVGCFSPEREDMLNSVKDLGLKIFGQKGWENSSLAEFYGGFLSIPESVKAYRLAKICLNMNSQPPVNGVNLKTFEIPAAGGFQLSDYRKDIDRLFIAGKEIEIFRNKDELRQKSLFYLDRENLRADIALAGNKKTLEEHTMEKRVADILKVLRQN